MKKKKTARGFALIEFKDHYDNACSLQQSSLAFKNCIWLGIDNADPKIMVSDAVRLGLNTNNQHNGWMSYPIPEQVSLSTRMHLTQAMVKRLLPHLTKFAETGEL